MSVVSSQFSKPIAAPEPLNPVEEQMLRLDDAAATLADAMVAKRISDYVNTFNATAATTLAEIK